MTIVTPAESRGPVENRPSETSSPQKEERVSLDDSARQAQPIPLHPQHGAHHHE